MRIANNISAFNAFNALNSTNQSLSKVINTLSTGLRINSAADDAAGFAISEKLRSQIGGLDTALRNSQDGISLLQTAEGALEQTNSMLQRMRDLSVQASNDSLTSTDRQYIQLEIDQLRDEIDRIAGTTQFNKKRILDGSSGALWASSDSGVKVRVNGGLTHTDNFGQKVSAEGNYRIEIKASPGQAQVQKSNIMLIKHKNVTMDRTINRLAGVNALSVSDVPAGFYRMTAEAPTEARVAATSSYGIELDGLADALHVSVSQDNLRNNASILFEVTYADDSSGDITLSAVSNVLRTDGTTETFRQDNIHLTPGEYVDLSAVLGLGFTGADPDNADGAFELQLQPGKSGSFSAGDKFVYSLNTAKDIEGADRCVKISGELNPSWPDGWQETMEIQTSNSFEQPTGSIKARVLFVIDDSGTMGGAIATVAGKLQQFITGIAENVDEISVGVSTYSDDYVQQRLIHHAINGGDWITVDKNNPTARDEALSYISDTLSGIQVYPGSVDHYYGIGTAINEYGLIPADNIRNYVVLVTDADLEQTGGNGVSRSDVRQYLTDSNSELITICPERANGLFQDSDPARSLVTMNSDGTSEWSVTYDSAGSWGSVLSGTIGPKIGTDAVKYALVENVPLYQFPQMQGIFPDASSPSQTITIHQGDKSYTVTIDPDDTLETLNSKLNQHTGASTQAEVVELENGNKAIQMVTSIPSGERVTYSGSQELITQLGLRSNFEQKYSLDADKVTDKDIHFRHFYVNKNTGHVHEGDIVLTTNSTELPEYDLLTNFEAAYIGQIPKHDVYLRDINNFWDSQGVFMVNQPKTVTITQGNGKTTSITLYETDTLEDVREKLNNAIAYGLGQGQHAQADKFVSFVTEESKTLQGLESVPGTFIVRSGISGKDGELYFSGDEEILNALGLNTIRESSESRFTASVYDAHSGAKINTMTAEGTVFKSIIPPEIDIDIDPMTTAISAQWDENTKRFIFGGNNDYMAMLHLKDNGLTFQTGANRSEDFSVQLGDMSSYSIGISRVNVATRETAARSIGILDRAISRVSAQRAKIGSYLNGLEYTTNNLTATSANLTAADSRLRDADMALTMMDFVRLQILNQSGTSMLAQANQLPQSVLSLLQG